MDNILDHVVVQGQRYDIVSPTAFGDYIETIGSACINPDGYAQGSTFLAKLGNEQFYYEATAAITQGSAILEGTNCKKTTVTGREAELASEIQTLDETVDSLNEALSNEVEARAKLGAHQLLDFSVESLKKLNTAGTWTGNSYAMSTGITFTLIVDSSGKVTEIQATGTASDNSVLNLVTKNIASSSMTSTGGDSETVDGLILSGGVSPKQMVVFNKNLGKVFIYIDSGEVVSSTKFYPLLRLATDSYTGYLPYVMTNSELTKKVDKIETINLTLNSTYFDNNTFCKVKKVGKLVSICIAGTTIGEIPRGNTDLSSNGALPVPADGEAIVVGFAWNTSGILGQLRILYGYLNFPFNEAIPSGTSFRVNMVYISK